jgi:type I restriction-modification system DNA methylase subunit
VRCGYTGPRLAQDYPFDDQIARLVGFFDKPWDARSACVAAVDANGDSRQAAQQCLTLGAPTVFVCDHDAIDCWKLASQGPAEAKQIKSQDVEGFFRTHKNDLSPESIYHAKRGDRGPAARQLWFVDIGLMPALERRAGETLHRLVEGAIQDLSSELKGQLRGHKAYVDLYKTVFWLLAAKLLHEKRVENFKRIDLTNVDEVFKRVGNHYADMEDLPPGGQQWRPAIDAVARNVAQWGFLGNVSTEALGHLYESALIDKRPKGPVGKKQRKGRDIRKELGIHSTPPVLVNHMLAQLWPLIEHIAPKDRRVFEPACGHGAFLVAALRWLREHSALEDGIKRHRYLSERLYGVERDPFACELAKLSLTLADVPYGNSWQIDAKDMFEANVLRKAAAKHTVILANPPYEAFRPADIDWYQASGEPVTALTKAVEMLKRTLPNLPPGGVFGIVMPQGALHDRESEPVREFLLNHCELSEVSLFADNLFEEADHETAILLGRRKNARTTPGKLWYRRVREPEMAAFKERLVFSSERQVSPARFERSTNESLLLPDLEEVWNHLKGMALLGSRVRIEQGFQFKGEEERAGREVYSLTRRKEWIRGVIRVEPDYGIWELPRAYWVDIADKNIRRPGAITTLGVPQVILNYAPVARAPWRLKAVFDEEGLALTSRFLAFRPKKEPLPLRVLWAIMNSPVANAYAYCFSDKRQTHVREWRRFPLPPLTQMRTNAILAAAEVYLRTVQPTEKYTLGDPDDAAVRQALLHMDAEVLRLYDLPPRLERQLLDLFNGVERKGVGCAFRSYFPLDFRPCIPLHEYLSDEYRRSTAGEIRHRLTPVQSEAAIAALDAAEAAAGG